MVAVRVQKSTKKASGAHVLDFKALFQLKDYLGDDDDMEFITDKSIDVDIELAPLEGDARKFGSYVA